MKEIWKDIKGYEGLYQVSNLGNVRSMDRITRDGRKIKGKNIKPHTNGNSRYLRAALCNNGKIKYENLHRLVAKAFIPNPQNKPEVNHKDENPSNNFIDNLEWMTSKENSNYGTGHLRATLNTNFDSIKEKTSKPINQYDMNGKFIKRFKSLSDVPFKGKGNISQCANNKKESSYGYKWKYDNNKYTLFVFSDPHAFYNETITALKKAGYNETNPHHKLVCLGDFTDRGEQSLEMYEYLHRLSIENKAIVLPGNHTKFFIDFLEGSYNPFNYLHNGLRETIADFWHRTSPFESWCLLEGQCDMTQENYAKWVDICRKEIMDEHPDLLHWLKSLPRYFETKHYIGVHGAIDTKVVDWHNPHCYRYNLIDWDALDFDDGYFFGSQINNTNKTVIIGHFGTEQLRKMYQDIIKNDTGDTYDILYRDDNKIIAIDATTNQSKKVNVLVIENEELLDNE